MEEEKAESDPMAFRYEKVQKCDGGKRIEINIPFPEIKRRIKGLLAISVNEEVWLKLEKE